MPYKFTNDRRHKFDKAKYRLRNWLEYDQGLKKRGSLTVWFSDEAIEKWKPNNKDRKRGAQAKYSNLAIETGLTRPVGSAAVNVGQDLEKFGLSETLCCSGGE